MNNILDIIKKIGLKAYIVVISLTMIIACEICNTENNIIHNISNNTAFIAIIGFIIFIIIAIKSFQKFVAVKKEDNLYAGKEADDFIDDFCNTEKINIIQKWFLYDYFKDYFNNQITDDNGCGGADNNELSSKETDTIKKQILNAQQNKYNNSYLAFCMLIDRCIDVANNKQQPYCFKEIAEAFGLEWKGRRYLAYIAYRVLGNIGILLEEYNKDKKEDSEKIACVNASVVTKWERDHGNKWFCNGGIKTPAWCCYPTYASNEGEDDREFILKLCNIVKEADNDKIEAWKETYYGLLENKCKDNKCDLKNQNVLNEVYEKYKESREKMTYEKLKNDEKI